MPSTRPEDLTPFSTFTGETHHGLQLLASYLMEAGPGDLVEDLQRQMAAWPDQDAVQDHLDVFCFMFERLDHGALDALREALRTAHGAATTAIGAILAHQREEAARMAQWQSVAAHASGLLGELRALVAGWNPLHWATEQFQIRMDLDAFGSPPNYAHFRAELEAELQRLLAQVDQHILDHGYSDAIALMRDLYAACASLDGLSAAYEAALPQGQTLREQSALAKAQWHQCQRALLAELQKMPLSGQYALLRLSQLAPMEAAGEPAQDTW